jgi:50S ribosomal protein L16 3-hydroxylase
MDITQPLTLLGGISPARFMRQYWQKKPLLIRQAVPGMQPMLARAALFALAGQDDVESRLITRAPKGGTWRLRHGPFARTAIPKLSQPGWTLLVQGLDLHLDAAHALLEQFAFVPRARLDDLMVSFATDGGGVGPHFDSYDVFLLQAQGQRRWRIGRQKDLTLQPDVPLKILRDFQPEQECLLEAGDMLYLPPRYAHDGVAQGECMTYSIGFRAPAQGEWAQDLMQRLADVAGDAAGARYADRGEQATVHAGAITPALQEFARRALEKSLGDPQALLRAVGESLSEPKAHVFFEPKASDLRGGLVLDRRSRMLYDERHIFINGESYRASGKDFGLLKELADSRSLSQGQAMGLSAQARGSLQEWLEMGWMHATEAD